MRGRFGCTRILFENKVSLQLTSRIQSHVHRNVIESHLFYRFLSSRPKIPKVSNRVWSRFAGKRLMKKMPKLLVVVQKNNLIQYKRLIHAKIKNKKPTQKFWTHSKTHTKIYLTHAKIMTQVKNILTRVTHSTHLKI